MKNITFCKLFIKYKQFKIQYLKEFIGKNLYLENPCKELHDHLAGFGSEDLIA